MLRVASERAAEAGVEINTIECSCDSLPHKDKSVDILTAANLIHMLDDPLPFFREVKRVMRPKGIFLLEGYNRAIWPILRILGTFQSKVLIKGKPIDGFIPVLNASFTKEELQQYFADLGFTNFDIRAGAMFIKAVIQF